MIKTFVDNTSISGIANYTIFLTESTRMSQRRNDNGRSDIRPPMDLSTWMFGEK